MNKPTISLKPNKKQLCVVYKINDSTNVEYCIESEDGTKFEDLEGDVVVIDKSRSQNFNLSIKKIYDDKTYCLYHKKISDGKGNLVDNVDKRYSANFSTKDIIMEERSFPFSLCTPIC